MWRFFIIIIAFIRLAAGEMEFRVYAYGLPVADVFLNYSGDNMYGEHNEIEYFVRTKGVIRAFYSIDNRYIFKLDSTGVLIEFRKDIEQFNMKQQYLERYREKEIIYGGGLFSRKKERPYSHPLLLIFEFQEQLHGGADPEMQMHLEGVFFRAELVEIEEPPDEFKNCRGHELVLYRQYGDPVNELTDIFSWKLTDENAAKFVFYDRASGELRGAMFRFKGLSVLAKRIR